LALLQDLLFFPRRSTFIIADMFAQSCLNSVRGIATKFTVQAAQQAYALPAAYIRYRTDTETC
jgi:hypothetical protein